MSEATISISGTTAPIKEETQAALEELAEMTHESVPDVLAKAVDAYWRQRILEFHNATYAALRADPQAWQEELEERKAWEATLADGLDEPWDEGLDNA